MDEPWTSSHRNNSLILQSPRIQLPSHWHLPVWTGVEHQVFEGARMCVGWW
jgi:hypothetical protein